MNVFSLHVGNDYLGSDATLQFCRKDARTLAARLKPFCAYTKLLTGVGREQGHLEGRKLLHRMESGDWAVITFSGHGTYKRSKDGDEANDQAVVWEDMEVTFDDEWADLLSDRPAGTYVFALVDCCHSGSMHRSLRRPRTIAFSKCRGHRRQRDYRKPRALTRVVMFSGSGDGPADFAYEGIFAGKGSGVLTHHALETLTQLKHGATYRDWFRAIRKRLPCDDYPQTPQTQGSRAMLNQRIPFI